MATSIQTFNGKSVLFNDIDLMAFIAIALKAAAKINDNSAAANMPTVWRAKLIHFGPGTIDLELEESMQSQEALSSVKTLLDAIRSELLAAPPTIFAQSLNDELQVPGIVFHDLNTDALIKVATSFEKLLFE